MPDSLCKGAITVTTETFINMTANTVVVLYLGAQEPAAQNCCMRNS